MKKFLTLLMVLFFIFTLSSCFNKKDDKNVHSLTVLADMTDGWVNNFNPFATSVKGHVQGFMYEYLIIFDGFNNNREHMWLAEDIITEPDNKTLTVKVRKNVKWSDGEEFNADDVIFSFIYSKNYPEIDRNGDWGENGKIDKVEKIDDYTVKVVMKEANRFHRFSVFYQKPMIPEHIWKDIKNPASAIVKKPVVTGPFSKIKKYSSEMIVIGRNPYYWKADDLEVDELRLPQFNSNDAALTLLQTGQVDWAHIFIPNAEQNYVKNDNNRKFWYGMNDAIRIAFNYMTPNENNLKAFQDPEFKIALSMAIDREAINEAAAFGYLSDEIPPVTGLPPALLGYKNPAAQNLLEQYTTFNLDAAKAKLDAAGYVDVDGDGWRENKEGGKIEFDILSPAGWTDWNDGAVIAADGMRKIGVKANAKAIDLGLIIDSWESGAHDALYSGYGTNTNIWKFYYDTIGDQSRVKTPTWWSITQTNYKNDHLTNLISQMPEANDTKLKLITDEIELFMTQNMINIPILYNGNWFVYNTSRFTGWATAENPFVKPDIVTHDSKVLQLLALKPVEK